MAIECCISPQAGSIPPRAQTASASEGQQSGGFASVLQGLGDPIPAAPAATPADPGGLDPALTQDQGSAKDGSVQDLQALPHRKQSAGAPGVAGAAKGEPAPSTSKTSVDPAGQALPQGSVPDSAAQALLAQFLGLAGGQTTPATTGASGALSLDAAARQASRAPALPAAAAPAGRGGGTPAESLAGLNLSQTAGDPSLPAAVGHGGATRWLPTTQAQGQVPWQSTVTSQNVAQEAQASLASVRDAAQDGTAQPSTGLTLTASAPGLVTALADSDLGVNGRRRGGAASGSEPVRLDALPPAGMGGAVIGSTLGGVVAGSASASGQPLEQAVAEQVKYWISNDVHNAELKFDGLGSESVRVSISMSGNEAQVVFRSDQAQTRELLGNAMTHLDQMLRAEGLTLAGAWVGSSGQQGQFGAQPQQAQPGPQRMPMATLPQVGATPAPVRALAPTDRAVDLFV